MAEHPRGVFTTSRARRPKSGSGVLLACSLAVLGIVVVSVLVAANRSQQGGGGSAAPAAHALPTLPVLTSAPETAGAAVTTRNVTYELYSESGAVHVTFVAKGADVQQLNGVDTPWTQTVARADPENGPHYVTVSAQNGGHGTLRCRILVDGKVVSERSTATDYGVVMCAKVLD